MIGSSNSTSCLVLGKKSSDAVSDSALQFGPPPRHSSTEGRFSILDERSKSSDSESDFEAQAPPVSFARRTISRPNFSKSVDYSAATTMTTSTSVSRFRIVPLENRYKRGRWSCHDYYEKGALSKTSKLCPSSALPATANQHPFRAVDVNNLSVRSLQEVVDPVSPRIFCPPLSRPIPHVTFSFNLSSDSEEENTASSIVVPSLKKTCSEQPLSQSPSKPRLLLPQEKEIARDAKTTKTPKKEIPDELWNALGASRERSGQAALSGVTLALNGSSPVSSGRLTPTEMLQSGLESTLKGKGEAAAAKRKYSSSASSAGLSGGSSSQMVAIDSKIEQAMDLVKTHLMFAVREEVELLRNRMVDLESTVCHLEAENAVLRQHISDDILRNLNLNS